MVLCPINNVRPFALRGDALIGAPASAAASYGVLVVAATLLFYLAATDLREFRIRNELILVLAALFFVHSFLRGAGSKCIGI